MHPMTESAYATFLIVASRCSGFPVFARVQQGTRQRGSKEEERGAAESFSIHRLSQRFARGGVPTRHSFKKEEIPVHRIFSRAGP
jgi:hypothetical protein